MYSIASNIQSLRKRNRDYSYADNRTDVSFIRDSVILTNTSSTSIVTSSYSEPTNLLFANCAVYNTGKCSYNNGVFYIGSTGIYYIHFVVKSSAGTNKKGIAVIKNNLYSIMASSAQYGSSFTGSHQISQIIQLTAGDFLELKLFGNGVSTTFTLDANFKLQIIRLY